MNQANLPLNHPPQFTLCGTVYYHTENGSYCTQDAYQNAYDEWLKAIGDKQRNPPAETSYKVCECGSESAGSNRHAYYCPKFEK